ncbi:MAG: FAD-binding protein [Deltaproteobacteria bacterium]|nr:FAD-binding protein [Deltaproteobacteria bacterium]
MKADVAVIGGGVAGTVAALRARAAGRQVVVLSAGWGASALTSGCVGLAHQAICGPSRTGREAVTALLRTSSAHPYNLVPGVTNALSEAIRFFRAGPASPPLRGASPDDLPLLLADDRGGLRLADLAAESHARGDLRKSHATIGVVDPIGLSWFQAHSVAKGLSRSLAAACSAGVISAAPNVAVVGLDYFRRQSDSLTTATDSARLLDVEGAAARFSAAIGEALALAPVDLLLFPPLIGVDATDAILDRIEAENKVVCAEMVGTSPGPSGLRFQRALEAMLAHAGVPIIRARVSAAPDDCVAALSGGRTRTLARLACGDGAAPKNVEARAFVLASGRYIGGGVEGTRPWAEGVLGFPIAARGEFLERESSAALTRDDPFEAQSLFAAGVRVDAELRPLARDRRPLYANVFAAGDLLAGHDGVVDGSAMGVALLTGHLAGRNAAAI